jgi:hypothetical protein
MRWKTWVPFGIGSLFGIVLVATCGGGSNSFTPRRDGFLVGDGNFASFDIATADAAGPPTTANCDQVSTHTQTDSSGNVITLSYYYAELDLGVLDPIMVPPITAVSCNPMCFGQGCGASCPMGDTCSDSGAPNPVTPQPPCTQTGVSFANNKVRVYCGYRETGTYPKTPQSNFDTGSTYQQVYVRMN